MTKEPIIRKQFIDLHCKSMDWFQYDFLSYYLSYYLCHEWIDEKPGYASKLNELTIVHPWQCIKKVPEKTQTMIIFLKWLVDDWNHKKNEFLISHCFHKCIFKRNANNNALLTVIVNSIDILLLAVVVQISIIFFPSQVEEVNFSKNKFLWQLATSKIIFITMNYSS